MKFLHFSVLLAALAFGSRADAAGWQICTYQARVLQHQTGQIQAVLHRSKHSGDCPPNGSVLSFAPETADYQSLLPRKKWPKKGRPFRLVYRYLDGICKNDGNDRACRIEHFSVLP